MTPPASYKKRVQVHTLQEIGWNPESITEHLDLTLRQLDYLSKLPSTRHKRRSRPVTIDTPKRKELVAFVTLNTENRCLSFQDIPRALSLPVSASAIKIALMMEGLNCRVARPKPFLSEKTCKNSLLWALEYKGWNEFDWHTILWTNESAMNVTGQQHARLIRRHGEEYDMNCIVPKFKQLGGCMVWGAISGLYGLGKFISTRFLLV
jgi:hypothetical protein